MASVNKVILVGNLGADPETKYLPSDAFATGLALYALRLTGKSAGNVEGRAVDYLLRTQYADGSWHVISRAIKIASEPANAIHGA